MFYANLLIIYYNILSVTYDRIVISSTINAYIPIANQ